MRDSFTFQRSIYDALKEVDNSTRVQLYDAICQYSFGIIDEPELTGVAKAFWLLIEPQLALNKKRYEAGKQGGRPLKEKPNENQMETKPKPNDNQTESKPKAKEEKKEKGRKEAKELKRNKEEETNKSSNESLFGYNNNNNNNACACEGKKTFAEWFNGALDYYESSIPRIQKMTPKRKAMVKEILDKGYTYEDIGKAVKNAAISMRLNGRERVNGKTPYKTDFDYIFNIDNFLKILEGKYN